MPSYRQLRCDCSPPPRDVDVVRGDRARYTSSLSRRTHASSFRPSRSVDGGIRDGVSVLFRMEILPRLRFALLPLAVVACGEEVVAPEPDPLSVTVTARYINSACTVQWDAVASDPAPTITFHVGHGSIENPRWLEEGSFRDRVSVEIPGPVDNNVTFLLEAPGYRRAANVGPSGRCF